VLPVPKQAVVTAFYSRNNLRHPYGCERSRSALVSQFSAYFSHETVLNVSMVQIFLSFFASAFSLERINELSMLLSRCTDFSGTYCANTGRTLHASVFSVVITSVTYVRFVLPAAAFKGTGTARRRPGGLFLYRRIPSKDAIDLISSEGWKCRTC